MICLNDEQPEEWLEKNLRNEFGPARAGDTAPHNDDVLASSGEEW